MTNREVLTERLLGLLAQIDFDRHYFGYYLAHADRKSSPMRAPSITALKDALNQTALDFAYKSRERFFAHTEQHQQCVVGLNVALLGSSVEFILSVRTDAGYIGGPFPELARQVARKRDPEFTVSPASPKLPFSNEDQLREVVGFGVSLFEDARDAIVSAGDWDRSDAAK